MMRTTQGQIRPRLDTSALISELCERDVPEIDWEKLGEDSNSVVDICTGLKLDAAHVKAGRETEAKRMLKFGVYEEVGVETDPWQKILEQQLAGLAEESVSLVRSRLVVKQVRGACKREDVFAATPPLAAMSFILSRAASRGHGR